MYFRKGSKRAGGRKPHPCPIAPRPRPRTNGQTVRARPTVEAFGVYGLNSGLDTPIVGRYPFTMDAKEFALWRQGLGISQEELAERWAGVSRSTIQNWEAGVSAIPPPVADA